MSNTPPIVWLLMTYGFLPLTVPTRIRAISHHCWFMGEWQGHRSCVPQHQVPECILRASEVTTLWRYTNLFIIIIIIIIFFWPRYSIPEERKNYAMQYKKSTKIKLEWTLLLLLLFLSPPAQSRRGKNLLLDLQRKLYIIKVRWQVKRDAKIFGVWRKENGVQEDIQNTWKWRV